MFENLMTHLITMSLVLINVPDCSEHIVLSTYTPFASFDEQTPPDYMCSSPFLASKVTPVQNLLFILAVGALMPLPFTLSPCPALF